MSDVNETMITLTADIVAAHVANNSIAVADIPALINNVHTALCGLGGSAAPVEAEKLTPAVSIRASVKPDYLVCLHDGAKLKMLKRHLMTHHGQTPEEYRAHWGLATDYPLVSSNYAITRQELALKIGLGKKSGKSRKK